jgi:hypothetical protein
MLFGMAFAFVSAGQAGNRAGLDSVTDDTKIRHELASDDTDCRVTDIYAVEIESHTPDEFKKVRFGKAIVGARGAAGDAVEALVDATKCRFAIEGCRNRMQGEDLGVNHGDLSLAAST